MKGFSQRESVLFGYSSQQSSFTNTTSSSSLHDTSGNSDIDFKDVFGGPPRRRSMIHDMRYSLSESTDSYESTRDDETVTSPSRWSFSSEKPVFGEETVYRRNRSAKYDFFDDIFRRGEFETSTSYRKHDQEIQDPLSSLQFSLPLIPSKAIDFPAFGSANCSSYISKDNTFNELDNSSTQSSALSRFSTQPSKIQEMTSKKGLDSSEDLTSNNSQFQFHFSMYQGGCKRVPLIVLLNKEKDQRSKEKIRTKRCSSTNGRKSPTSTLPNVGFSFYDHLFSNFKSFKSENDEGNNDLLPDESIQEKVETCRIDEESTIISSPELETPGNVHVKDEAHKAEMKTLRSLLFGIDDTLKLSNKKESTMRMDKKTSVAADSGKISKKQDIKTALTRKSGGKNASFQGSPVNSGNNLGRNRFNRKVEDFVKIYNRKSSSKPEDATHSQKQSMIEDVSVKNAVNASGELNSEASTPASILNDSGVIYTVVSSLNFQENFLIESCGENDNEPDLQQTDHEQINVIDAKIQKWSKGKEENIRSLLSTLQYIIWPESGWKTIPLVDIIEGNAVKRAYQKALLHLHPDKLQQKGASSHQIYTAEKVFNILQEAWAGFNSLGSYF